MSATIPVVPSAPAEPAPAALAATVPTAEGTNAGQPVGDWTNGGAPYGSTPGFASTPAPEAAAPKQWMSISSLVLGIVSIFAGWTFFMPIAGLVFGILALRKEPANRTMAIWGVVLNGVLLAGSLLVALAALLFGLAFLPFLAFMPFDSVPFDSIVFDSF